MAQTPYVVNFYFDYMKEHPWEVLINTLFMFLTPIQDVFLPHIYGVVIDNLQSGSDILYPFTIVLITMIFLQLGYYLEDWHDSILYPKLQSFLRSKMLTTILEKYENAFKELNIGEIIAVFVKAPTTMTTWFERVKNVILPFLITFLIAVIYFFTVDWVIGLSLLVLGCFYMAAMYFIPNGCSDVTLERDVASNKVHEEIDDMLRNLFSIYGQGQKEKEVQRTQKYEDVYTSLFRKTVGCIFKYKFWITPVAIIYLSIFIFRCYTLLNAKTMTASKFIPVFIITLYLLNFMVYTNDQFRDMVFEWGMIKSADEILKTLPQQNINTGVADEHLQEIPQTGLGLFRVDFKYDQGKHNVIHDLSIHFEIGDRVAIVGDIGSGKSTIMKLLLKYYEPQQGFVYLHGRPYYQITNKELRQNIGYVPQVPILFNRSVLENIKYGTNVSRETVMDFLVKHDLLKEFSNLEYGIDTKIGKNGSILSGGQRQLVWCIRVFLSNPEVLILDEPTASVDVKTKDLLISILEKLMQDRIVIMITHDEYLMSKASRVVEVKAGKVIADNYIRRNSEN
jgi:ABC-type multidrug transport system fused ATPase/permease subunit